MSSNRKASAMSPVTSRPIETAGRNWLPRVVAKETISEAPNIRAVKRAMDCKFSAYRSARSEAGPVTPPAAMFHPHSGHTGSSEAMRRSEEHTSELQSPCNLVCRLLLEKKKKTQNNE